ncbi:hypothetical protein Tco_0123015 [Tanacetum coccineum]
MGLWYSKDFGFELIAYSDTDLAGCLDDYKSTSEGVQFLGDKLFTWSSKKQDCTALSTVEVEYCTVIQRAQLLYHAIRYNILVPSTLTSVIISSRSMLNKVPLNFTDLFTKALPKERAQQIILADQLVPKFQTIERCNNYAMLQSIPCSPECKIVGQILLDHPLSYALTSTADVPVVYLQQLWKIVCKVPDTKDTIKFTLDT